MRKLSEEQKEELIRAAREKFDGWDEDLVPCIPCTLDEFVDELNREFPIDEYSDGDGVRTWG